jgi:hypothetical protein
MASKKYKYWQPLLPIQTKVYAEEIAEEELLSDPRDVINILIKKKIRDLEREKESKTNADV